MIASSLKSMTTPRRATHMPTLRRLEARHERLGFACEEARFFADLVKRFAGLVEREGVVVFEASSTTRLAKSAPLVRRLAFCKRAAPWRRCSQKGHAPSRLCPG